MQPAGFLKHWSIVDNPFSAEEARDDPVFARLLDQGPVHPDFDKVLGQPDRPRAAVVFGEKGSGKTALRLLLERRLQRYNSERTDKLAWVVRYDDLNRYLDRTARHQKRLLDDDTVLKQFRLADHMDAILSLATTRLVNLTLGESEEPVRGQPGRTARKMPRGQRLDLAVLAVLYDQPAGADATARVRRLRRILRLTAMPWTTLMNWLGVGALLVSVGLVLGMWMLQTEDLGLLAAASALAGLAILLLGAGAWRKLRIWRLSRRIRREIRAVERSTDMLITALSALPMRTLSDMPIPLPGDQDARYQLIQRLVRILEQFDYSSMVVLVDRVDEPTAVSGDPQRMRDLVWPMLNNKFLQQDRVGMKLLLPIELKHLLLKEDAAFFQRARLDKQHMVDELNWSGAMLYDLCNSRLQACQSSDAQPIMLKSIFDDEVNERDLIDALDSMHQPRDAFKFLYRVVQEHCSNVPEGKSAWRIPRLTLENVRRRQSQRVQEFHRGLTPA